MNIKLIFFLLFFPIFVSSQNVNHIDNDGLKQGLWKKKYPNGVIRYKGTFKDNIPTGIFLYYYSTSELRVEKEFFQKEKAAAHFFYKNGELKASGLYINQQKDSTWNYYNHDSVLILSEQYRGGKLNGKSITYYDDGSKVYEVKNFLNGIEHGEWKQYYINGNIKMSSNFDSGKREGNHIFYYPLGEVNFKGLYKKDEKIGEWIYYTNEGVVDTTIYFKHE